MPQSSVSYNNASGKAGCVREPYVFLFWNLRRKSELLNKNRGSDF